MRRLTFIILALATLLPSLAQAYDILILQSRRDPAYEDVLKGLRAGHNASQRVLVLSDYAEVDVVRIVREDRPRVILAVGDAALTATRNVRNTPVVAVMSLGINSHKRSHDNLTGVGMLAPPARYIAMFKAMKIRRVGVICNPAKSGWYLRLARQAAEAAGIELVVREVSAPRESIERLSTLAGKVDALWMLPDSTAVTRGTVEAYFRFGQEQNIPVVSFAASYLGLGAAAVLEIDLLAIGRQADAMVAEILRGTRRESMSLDFPKGITLKTNSSVLKRLRIAINEDDSPLQ
ncbi:MAG: ABC transporter substrate-binding protein [Deltaproteobacteria bacterium]|jgi:putative ABC transport system substrate-binding protein|nr:ABC transporter substrate-binding protein [Deltaproteobacteria bacterium]